LLAFSREPVETIRPFLPRKSATAWSADGRDEPPPRTCVTATAAAVAARSIEGNRLIYLGRIA
jgi:hypothetical protein